MSKVDRDSAQIFQEMKAINVLNYIHVKRDEKEKNEFLKCHTVRPNINSPF